MGSYEWDTTNNRVSWSEELYRIYGVPNNYFRGTVEGFLELVHPDDRERTRQIISESVNNCHGFEFIHRIIRPDGEVRIIRAQGQPIKNAEGHTIRMIGAGQDITEQVLADEKLRAGEELLRRVVTAAPLIIWSIDRDGKIILAEGRALSDLNVDPSHIIGQDIFELLKESPKIVGDIRRAMAGEEVATEVQGGNGIYETRYAPLRNEAGEVIGVVAMALNINERVEMENALRASEARFRTIFESSAVGKAILDLQTQIVVANHSLQTMLGYSNAELSGRNLKDLLLPLDYQNNRALFEDFFKGGDNIIQLEQRLLDKENRLVWGNFTFSWMRKSNGDPWFAILMVEDITARKQAEAELSEVKRQLIMSREAERLRLAQDLHDEPLQELYGVMFTLSDFGKYIQQPEGLEELQNTQVQVSHLVDSLRGICRDLRPPALSPFGLEGAIQELAERFQNDHPQIQLDLDMMNDGQLLDEHVRLTLFRIVQQALSNIVRHAQASQVSIRFAFDASQIELVIKDNGKGFNVPRRWVSLVRQGHLGLAGAAERVETVDGKFNVYSQPGAGTTIHVTVPRHGAAEVL
jgi:PAS domain S-box-containing protein